MFRSFFPNPRIFFMSAVVWSLLAIALWFLVGEELGSVLNVGAGIDTTPGN